MKQKIVSSTKGRVRSEKRLILMLSIVELKIDNNDILSRNLFHEDKTLCIGKFFLELKNISKILKIFNGFSFEFDIYKAYEFFLFTKFPPLDFLL